MPKFYTILSTGETVLLKFFVCVFNIKNGGKSNINPHIPMAKQKRWVISSYSTKEGDKTPSLRVKNWKDTRIATYTIMVLHTVYDWSFYLDDYLNV